MDKFLSDKRAVITGGSKGIGLAIAKALLEQGADVLICARSKESLGTALSELKAAAPGRKVIGRQTDVSRHQDVAELFAAADSELGGLDILINNAGSGTFRPVADLTVEEWDRVVGTNLSGAFYCSREALLRFRTTQEGAIINISSLAGKNPFAGGSAYNASKFGLNGFSEAMMLDHRNEGVRVSTIMPGSVDTRFGGQPGGSDWKIAPEDIAEIVVDILRMPKRTLVSRVEVRPSRPQKG